MGVPLFSLEAHHAPLQSELAAAFARVTRSGRFILGDEVERFEAELAAACQVPHAVGLSSGTDALLCALLSLGIGPGDEVLVPAFTFYATASCVSRAGATPIFCDVCPACFNLDPNDAARRLTPRTKAIIPVHLFGQAAEMDALTTLASKHQLALIEDAAQATGARYRGNQVGSFGHATVLSFFPTKNVGALGDAGALLTRDPDLARRVRQLRMHGESDRYIHSELGGNFRLDALQAALLRVKLPHLDAWINARQRNAARYTDLLAPIASTPPDASCTCRHESADSPPPVLILPAAYPHNQHTYNQYTVRVSGGQRDALRKHLAALKIDSAIYYPKPVHHQPVYAGHPQASETLPTAERLATEVLSLPIFPELSAAQLEEVAAAVNAFFT